MTTAIFETDRLSLAPPALGDFDDSASMWSDEEVVRFIGGTPSTRGDAWGRLHRNVGHWALLDFGYWTVRERISDRFVGEVGFADFRRGLGPAFDDYPECGWALAPWAHGKGYATEAVQAAIDWAARNLSADRIVCMIHPDNRPSLKVAANCGFRPVGETTFKAAPTMIFECELSVRRLGDGLTAKGGDR